MRLLRETLPHFGLGMALAGCALVPWWWARLPLVTLAAAVIREHAQKVQKERDYYGIRPEGSEMSQLKWEFWEELLTSPRRWLDIAEVVAGAGVVVGAVWLL